MSVFVRYGCCPTHNSYNYDDAHKEIPILPTQFLYLTSQTPFLPRALRRTLGAAALRMQSDSSYNYMRKTAIRFDARARRLGHLYTQFLAGCLLIALQTAHKIQRFSAQPGINEMSTWFRSLVATSAVNITGGAVCAPRENRFYFFSRAKKKTKIATSL